jgi:hypothetical protein
MTQEGSGCVIHLMGSLARKRDPSSIYIHGNYLLVKEIKQNKLLIKFCSFDILSLLEIQRMMFIELSQLQTNV